MTQDELFALIDQATSESWKELDLSNKGLALLPLEIAQLSNLKVLSLDKNQIAKCPVGIAP